jgi:cell division protease FtsH
MLNEAAISAARNDKAQIEMEDITEAATKVKLGPAKKRVQSEEDKAITAYHEAGHAVVAHYLPKTDPVQRISIVARGMSLGHTEISPNGDRTHETKTRLLQAITAMMGGRAAEEMTFREMTAGAASDIKNATKFAKAMVIDFGMSALGPINFGASSEYGDFGNMEWYEGPSNSQAVQEKIDTEVKKIIDLCYKSAQDIILKHKKELDGVVKVLLERETIDKDEFEKIVGKKIEK